MIMADTGTTATGFGTLVAAVAALITALRTKNQSSRTEAKVDATKIAVNGHATAQEKRVDQLAAALTDSGVDVPPRPAHPTPEAP